MWEQPYKLFSVQLQWKCWVRRGRGGEECVLSRCPTSNLSPLRGGGSRRLTGTIHLVKLKREELEIRSPVIFAPTLIIRPFTCLPLETSWSLALVWRNPNQFLSPFTCLLETDAHMEQIPQEIYSNCPMYSVHGQINHLFGCWNITSIQVQPTDDNDGQYLIPVDTIMWQQRIGEQH